MTSDVGLTPGTLGRRDLPLLLFEEREVREAIEYSLIGGTALHVHVYTAPRGAPSCFRKSANQRMAHLLDQDAERVERLARRFGVRVISVEKRGTRHQHIDLCGKPLERATAAAVRAEICINCPPADLVTEQHNGWRAYLTPDVEADLFGESPLKQVWPHLQALRGASPGAGEGDAPVQPAPPTLTVPQAPKA